MKITERIVSCKTHTLGFVANHKELTRREAVRAAVKGKISNVRVVNSHVHGAYLVGTNGTSLYDLPTRVATSRKLASRRSK